MGLAGGVAVVLALSLGASAYGFFLMGHELLFGLFALTACAPVVGLAVGLFAGRGRKGGSAG